MKTFVFRFFALIVPLWMTLLLIAPVSYAASLNDGTYTIEYVIVKAENDSVSMANDYFQKPATLTVSKGEITAQIQLTYSDWITVFKVPDIEQKGQFADTRVVSRDKAENTRIVQFPVADLSKPLESKIHVTVESINYDHDYTIRFVFDMKTLSPVKSDDKAAGANEGNDAASGAGGEATQPASSQLSGGGEASKPETSQPTSQQAGGGETSQPETSQPTGQGAGGGEASQPETSQPTGQGAGGGEATKPETSQPTSQGAGGGEATQPTASQPSGQGAGSVETSQPSNPETGGSSPKPSASQSSSEAPKPSPSAAQQTNSAGEEASVSALSGQPEPEPEASQPETSQPPGSQDRTQESATTAPPETAAPDGLSSANGESLPDESGQADDAAEKTTLAGAGVWMILLLIVFVLAAIYGGRKLKSNRA